MEPKKTDETETSAEDIDKKSEAQRRSDEKRSRESGKRFQGQGTEKQG